MEHAPQKSKLWRSHLAPNTPLAWPRATSTPAALACLLQAGGTRVSRALRHAVWALGLLLGLLTGLARASPVEFNFAVEFLSGPIAGQTGVGTFNVASEDCGALGCSGIFTPSGPANSILGPTGTLLDFQIVVDGVTFTASSDDLYPDFPSVTLSHDLLTRIDFLDFGPPSLSIFGDQSNSGGIYTDENFDTSVGRWYQIAGPSSVPEPPTALLVAAALVAGLSAGRRRIVR